MTKQKDSRIQGFKGSSEPAYNTDGGIHKRNGGNGTLNLSIPFFLMLCILCGMFFSILSAEPPYSSYWIRKGYPEELWTVMSDMRSAEMLAEKLREDETPEALFELGRLYFSRGLYRQALAFFQRTEFGDDEKILCIGLCQMILGENDSANFAFAQISNPRLRAWSSTGLAKIAENMPSAINDYPYLINFFADFSKPTDTKRTGGYTLQFGAFADSTRANLLIEKLKDIGLSPYIQEKTTEDRIFYRVRAEHFATKSEAEEAGTALGDQFIYMVVPEE